MAAAAFKISYISYSTWKDAIPERRHCFTMFPGLWGVFYIFVVSLLFLVLFYTQFFFLVVTSFYCSKYGITFHGRLVTWILVWKKISVDVDQFQSIAEGYQDHPGDWKNSATLGRRASRRISGICKFNFGLEWVLFKLIASSDYSPYKLHYVEGLKPIPIVCLVSRVI